MSHVSVKMGCEGPRHDPYSYTEMTVKRPNGDTIVIHSGALTDWCHVTRGDGNIVLFTTEGVAATEQMFKTYVGCTPRAVFKAYESIPVRRAKQHPCRPRAFINVEGYPGETFMICVHCNEPLDYHFNRSAVE